MLAHCQIVRILFLFHSSAEIFALLSNLHRIKINEFENPWKKNNFSSFLSNTTTEGVKPTASFTRSARRILESSDTFINEFADDDDFAESSSVPNAVESRDMACYFCNDCLPGPMPSINCSRFGVKNAISCAVVSITYPNGATSVRRHCVGAEDQWLCNTPLEHASTGVIIRHQCCYEPFCNREEPELSAGLHLTLPFLGYPFLATLLLYTVFWFDYKSWPNKNTRKAMPFTIHLLIKAQK